MDNNLTLQTAINGLSLTEGHDHKHISGIVPNSVINSGIKKTITILGITPENFIKKYAAEFDFDSVMNEFNDHCKDFKDELSMETPSKALEFSGKILFQYGPYIRNKKSKCGNEAIRFRFQYDKESGEKSHSVIVILGNRLYAQKENTDKVMVITSIEANLLAIVTLNKAIALACANGGSMLMTPLCRAVYGRGSIKEMALELKMDETTTLKMINSSTATGGQHLPESDMACAIVSMFAITKKVANKVVRNQIITNVIQQFASKHKVYDSEKFNIISKFVQGGVPQGIDSETLIEKFTNKPMKEISLRMRVIAQMQSEVKVFWSGNSADGAPRSSVAQNAETATAGQTVRPCYTEP